MTFQAAFQMIFQVTFQITFQMIIQISNQLRSTGCIFVLFPSIFAFFQNLLQLKYFCTDLTPQMN